MKNNDFEMKVIDDSIAFWSCLFSLFDKQKCTPTFLIGPDQTVEKDLDDGKYILKMNRDRVWFVEIDTGKAKCVQKKEQKHDKFPYTKMLDFYIKHKENI